MRDNSNYHDQINRSQIEKLREILNTLPSFCKIYFRGMNDIIAARTKIAYAYDLRVFFEYVRNNTDYCNNYEMPDIPMSILDKIKREDIEEYLEYLSLYKKDDDNDVMNEERGKSRKLASLRSFYNYV